jgi:hypothetical protein
LAGEKMVVSKTESIVSETRCAGGTKEIQSTKNGEFWAAKMVNSAPVLLKKRAIPSARYAVHGSTPYCDFKI